MSNKVKGKIKKGDILQYEDGSIYLALENGDAITLYEAHTPSVQPNKMFAIQIGMTLSPRVTVIGHIDES